MIALHPKCGIMINLLEVYYRVINAFNIFIQPRTNQAASLYQHKVCWNAIYSIRYSFALEARAELCINKLNCFSAHPFLIIHPITAMYNLNACQRSFRLYQIWFYYRVCIPAPIRFIYVTQNQIGK